MTGHRCRARTVAGGTCYATPLRDSRYCFVHDPAHAQEAAEARRLGGQRRRREHTLAGAYELDGLASVSELRRWLEVAAYEALALDVSAARVRALISVVHEASSLLQLGEIESRLQVLEATQPSQPRTRP
jgi:hypothetical protein